MTETTSTRAVLSLVCGILGVTGACPCIGSIAAILFGLGDRSAIARTGVLLGWIALVLLVVGFGFSAAAACVFALAEALD